MQEPGAVDATKDPSGPFGIPPSPWTVILPLPPPKTGQQRGKDTGRAEERRPQLCWVPRSPTSPPEKRSRLSDTPAPGRGTALHSQDMGAREKRQQTRPLPLHRRSQQGSGGTQDCLRQMEPGAQEAGNSPPEPEEGSVLIIHFFSC